MNRVVIISDEMFSGCSALESITLSNVVVEIGKQAFYNCKKMKLASLPSSLVQVKPSAFQYCEEIQQLVFPAGLKTIESSAFSGCTKLEFVDMSASGGNINSTTQTLEAYAFSGCIKLKKVVLNSKLTDIGDQAFNKCTALRTITIPTSVTRIGKSAFAGCTALSSVQISAGSKLKTIDTSAFEGCTILSEINLEDARKSLVTLGEKAFYGCKALSTLIIPERVTSIGVSCFQNCSGLFSVIMRGTNDNEKMLMGKSVFSGCTSLETVSLAERLTKLEDQTFYNCPALTKVVVHTLTEFENSNNIFTKYDAKKLTIYCKPNSKAELYAIAHKILYADISGMSTVVTGISLSPTKLTLSIDDSKTLRATVKPASAASNAYIKWDSTNEAVATVDTNGTVTAHKGGQTYIIAVSGEYAAVSIVTVKSQISEYAIREINRIVSANYLADKYKVITNYAPTLEDTDLELPDGMKWKDRTTSLSLFSNNAGLLTTFPAYYEEENKEPVIIDVPIKLLTFTGLQVAEGESATRRIPVGSTEDLEVTLKKRGIESIAVENTDYKIKWAYADTESKKIVTLYTDGSVHGLKKGTANVVATLYTKQGSKEKKTSYKVPFTITVISESADNKLINDIVMSSSDVNLIQDGSDDYSLVLPYNSDGSESVESGYYKAGDTFKIDTEVETKGGVEVTTKVAWTSSNTSAAKVSSTKDGIKVTIKGKGTTVITGTAQDADKFKRKLVLVCDDFRPRVSSSLTLNMKKGSSEVPIYPAYASDVSNVEILTKSGDATPFSLTATGEENLYSLEADLDKIKAKTYSKMIMRVNVSVPTQISLDPTTPKVTGGTSQSFDLPLTIKVTSSNPKATVTQSKKANLFYLDEAGEGKLKIVPSSGTIESISWEEKNDTDYYDLELNDAKNECVIKANGSPDSTEIKAMKKGVKGTLFIKFEGYDVPIKKSVTIKAGYTVPKIVTKSSSKSTFYPEYSIKKSTFGIYNNTAKEYLELRDGTVTVTPNPLPTGFQLVYPTADESNRMRLSYEGTSSSTTLKLIVNSDTWREPIKISHTATVEKSAKPKLKLSKSEVTLNANSNMLDSDKAILTYSLNEATHEPIDRISYVGRDMASRDVIANKSLVLTYSATTGEIFVHLNRAVEGTYKLNVFADFEGVKTSAASLTVKAVKQSAKLTLTPEGNINLINREDSKIKYTPAISGVNGKIKTVSLNGIHSQLFTCEYKDKVINVRAKEKAILRKDTEYTITVEAHLDTGYTAKRTVKVIPVQLNPTLVSTHSTYTMSNAAIGEKNARTLAFSVKKPVKAVIEKVELTNYTGDKGWFAYEGDKLYIKKAGLKPGTYKLKFRVYMKDRAINESAVYKEVKVKVTY